MEFNVLQCEHLRQRQIPYILLIAIIAGFHENIRATVEMICNFYNLSYFDQLREFCIQIFIYYLSQKRMSEAGAAFGILACVFGVVNLSFIVPDLIYAYQGTQCVTAIADGISFNLSTWLQVDAYMRIAMVSLLILVAIVGCCCASGLGGCAIFVICFMLLYSLFSLSWTIVGSVLFWGKLNPTGICQGPVQAYMYALLIITYVFTCLNCLYNLNSGKNRQ